MDIDGTSPTAVIPHIKLNGQPVSVVHKDKHLGN